MGVLLGNKSSYPMQLMIVSNNRAERAIKPIVIGRKNYLFMGGPKGGEAAAVMYTLVEMCKQNKVEPFTTWRTYSNGSQLTLTRKLRSYCLTIGSRSMGKITMLLPAVSCLYSRLLIRLLLMKLRLHLRRQPQINKRAGKVLPRFKGWANEKRIKFPH